MLDLNAPLTDREKVVGVAMGMIASIKRWFLSADPTERMVKLKTWHALLEEIPTEKILEMTYECLRDREWEPAPHDLVAAWRKKSMPFLDPDRAAEIIREAALAASWMDPPDRQRQIIEDRVRAAVSAELVSPLVATAFDMRRTIRDASIDNRAATNAAIRRAYEVACERATLEEQQPGGRLAAVTGNRIAQIPDDFQS